jgi:hypothetical protein
VGASGGDIGSSAHRSPSSSDGDFGTAKSSTSIGLLYSQAPLRASSREEKTSSEEMPMIAGREEKTKHRPSFLSSAPHPASRWEGGSSAWQRKDADVYEGDLERADSDMDMGYRRSASMSSLNGFSSNRMSSAERWKNMAAQLVYSPVARFYYACMIAVTMFEICVTIYDPHHAPHTRWFIGLELFMVAMLMNEVIVRFIADGSPRSFLRNPSNIFDIIVAMICLGTVIFVILNPFAFEGLQEWVRAFSSCQLLTCSSH